MTEAVRVLKPANENPWYVLMTLYGEQAGKYVDNAIVKLNRRAWNSWVCQGLSVDEQIKVASQARVAIDELRNWQSMRQDVVVRHREEMMSRNDDGFLYPGFPEIGETYALTGLEFEAIVSLESYIFKNLPDFTKTQFRRELFLRSTVFLGAVNFILCSFQNRALFINCHFEGPAEFLRADFHGLASFHQARFSSSANFTAVNFLASADFDAATFLGYSHFQEAAFSADGSKGKEKLEFSDCQFEKPSNFQRTKFEARYPNLSGAIFHDRTPFTADPGYWPSAVQKDPALAKASCATIRHALGKQGLPEEEHFFFRREMGFAAQIGGWWERLPYRTFGAVSDYGYSIARPAISLFWVWFLPALAFAAFRVTGVPVSDIPEVLWSGALSFANLFPVFGFHRVWFDADKLAMLNPWLKALSGAQTVVSLPLLFFLGLGLRTRFRMR